MTTHATSTSPESAAPPASAQPIKVILYSTKGSGLHYGGPGMTAYRLYRQNTPDRMRVTLVHGWAEQAKYDDFHEQIFLSQSGTEPWKNWRLGRATVRWVRQNARKYDVLHGLQGFQNTCLAAVEAERQGVPAVIKLAAHKADLADKPGLKGLLGLPAKRRKAIRSISGIIAISEAIADELRGYGFPDRQIVRIPNGVDIEQFRPAASSDEKKALRESLGWDDRPVILFSGVMTDRKRPILVAETLPLLKAKGIEPHYVFAGPFSNAPEEQAFMAVADRLDPDRRRLSLLGFCDNVADLYRAADAFVLPSKSEGMPNALLEAMASGLPGAATAISGVTDIIDDGTNGLLVEPTAESLADALIALLTDDAKRSAMSRAARAKIEGKFSTKAVFDRHEALFRRIMAGGDAAE